MFGPYDTCMVVTVEIVDDDVSEDDVVFYVNILVRVPGVHQVWVPLPSHRLPSCESYQTLSMTPCHCCTPGRVPTHLP